MSANSLIVILGAGPTGLGAAWRLAERGHDNWTLYEAAPQAGGLASTVMDAHGFLWDLGGHVLFSHYTYFDDVANHALGDAWVEHVREAWVWMRERWIPYPFQNNIRRLPEDELKACVDGLKALQNGGGAPPKTFRDWLLGSFGQGICDSFLFPYNRKVWAYDPSALNVEWMGERVATVDLQRILDNIALERDDVGWGPNNTFRFPLRGGTGAIWKGVQQLLPKAKLHFNRSIARINTNQRALETTDGQRTAYDALISTMPLDRLLAIIDGPEELKALAPRFVHSSSHIIGIGLKGTPPADLATKCWIYFPEPEYPFYRVTVFSNYSPNNAPAGHWSLMAEVSESPEKPVDIRTVVDAVVAGFERCGFIDRSNVVSRWHRRLEHGYPTPWFGRDAVLDQAQHALQLSGIYSRGRFGAWKYEVSNQDHSLMQGVEAVERILDGARERTFNGEMTSVLTHARSISSR
ncbi:MAG: FAD-dependent oxidoreductase [Cyanobacteria bacterium]|nr:FAD-dependent oxidoreductase [Cyanobacteriota bacterium]